MLAMTTTTQPTVAKDRIVFLDVLRGFALTGILFANILSWSGLKFLPFEEIVNLGNAETDAQLYKVLKFFVDTKFYTIFSVLFGVGFYMQLSKNKDNPGFASLYFRRLVLLFCIGLIHASFWSGDILTLYAIMGAVLLAFRKISSKKLLPLALGFYFLPVLLDILYMYTFARGLPVLEAEALKVYPDMTPEAVVAGFQSGTFATTLKTNLHNLVWRWYDFIPSGRPFKILGLFFLGSYLFHIRFFTEGALRWKNALVFLILGLGFTSLSMLMKGSLTAFSQSWQDVLDRLIHEIGQVSLSLSYICLLAMAVNRFQKFVVFQWLKNYGRMSLTSYVGHTFFGILVFYPLIAWGYFGKVTLQSTYYIAIAILVVQIVYSSLWFRLFKFGPIEWLWRCATHGKWFPIRK
jgi:uncharacterized protein